MCIFFFSSKNTQRLKLCLNACLAFFCYFWRFKRQLVAFTGFGIKVTARIIPALSLGPAFQPLGASQAPAGEEGLVGARGGSRAAPAPHLITSLAASAAAPSEFVNTFPRVFLGRREKRDYKVLTSSQGCSRDALRVVSLRRAPSRGCGESGDPTPSHGTVPTRQRERAASPPGMRPSGHAGLSHLNLTSSHQSFWQEEQIILGESCFWRLLNCSWHCSERFNSLENPKHFNIARILAHRMSSPTAKRDPAHRGDAPPLPF